MLAEDGYMLDNMTHIEIEYFVSFQRHSTISAGLRAFSGLEKQMQYFIARKLPTCRVLFIPCGTKRLIARNKYVRVLPKNILERENRFCSFAGISGRAPLVIPQGH